MIYAYTRVSSLQQNLDRQTQELKRSYNVDVLFEEKLSGKNLERPKLLEMISLLNEGDTVVVLELSRLARSQKDFLNLIEVFKQKKVKFISHKEKVDLSTPIGMLILSFMAAFNEYERSYIRERQADGIALAKKRGVYTNLSRFKHIDQDTFIKCLDLVNKGEMTKKQMAEKLNISTVTLWKRLQKTECLYTIQT